MVYREITQGAPHEYFRPLRPFHPGVHLPKPLGKSVDHIYQNPEESSSLLGSEDFAYAQNAVQEEAAGEQFAEFEL